MLFGGVCSPVEAVANLIEVCVSRAGRLIEMADSALARDTATATAIAIACVRVCVCVCVSWGNFNGLPDTHRTNCITVENFIPDRKYLLYIYLI